MRSPLTLLLFLFSSSVAMSGERAAKVLLECSDAGSCVVPFDEPASQDSDPFLFNGKVVDATHPQFKTYKSRLRKFPNVQSCLEKRSETGARSNLLELDWGRIDGTLDMEVCYFRMAASIGNAEAFSAWLRLQGYEVHNLHRTLPNKTKPRFKLDPIYRLEAYDTREHFRSLVPLTFFKRLIGWEYWGFEERGSLVNAAFSEDFSVVHMEITISAGF